MLSAQKLVWYVRRLTSMSAVELAHRLVEQIRRRRDRSRVWGWEGFGAFRGDVNGLPGLRKDVDLELAALASEAARDATAGRFRFLGQRWPEPAATPWWRGGIWFLDPVTGLKWPGADVFAFDVPYRHDHERGDVKFVWEINRLQFLPPLAVGDPAHGSDTAFAILQGWMDANPPYQGINWTNGIEAATRLVSVFTLLSCIDHPYPDEMDLRLRAFIEAHARWIDRYPSLHSSANNHRVSELAALFLTGLCAPGLPDARRYLAEARAGLEAEILRQFHTDGVGAEQSPTYAAYSLEWFAIAGVGAEERGAPFSPAYKERARAAAEHLQWLLDDGGCVPRIGDDDEGRVIALAQAPEPRYVASIVSLTRRWLGLAEMRELTPTPELRDSLFASPTGGASSDLPKLWGVRIFLEGGYTVARLPTSKGPALLVFDHAPLGFLSIAAHGHADALSIWLHWGDEAIIVDAGTYLYHSGGSARDEFRGTPAHNTLSIEGEDQSRISGPFNWSVHARTRLLEATQERVTAEHQGFLQRFGMVHRRTVSFEPDGYLIEDRLIGQPKRRGLAWTSGLLLAPGVKVSLDADRAELVTPAGLRLALQAGPGQNWALQDARCSPAFNVATPCNRLMLQGANNQTTDDVVSRVRITLTDSHYRRDTRLGERLRT